MGKSWKDMAEEDEETSEKPTLNEPKKTKKTNRVSTPKTSSNGSHSNLEMLRTVLLAIVTVLVALSWLTSPTPKWEYKVEAIPDLEWSTKANRLGKAGWEIVTARRATSGSSYNTKVAYECIFKRLVRY